MTADKITRLRLRVQREKGMKGRQAQLYLAGLLAVSRTTWYRWEVGVHKMNPSYWELLMIKLGDTHEQTGQ